VADEPLAFGETWGEGEMAAGPGATEFSCDEKKMSWSGTGAVWGVVFCYSAEKGDGDEELAGSDGFATDNGETEFFGEKGESAIGLAEALGGAGVGATYGEEGGSGGGSGGGEIAEGAGESFAANEGGGSGSSEVDAFDDGIGFEDEIEVFRK